MSRICENVEKVTNYNLDEFRLSGTAIHNTIARCAVDASSDLPIKAIVASTLTGRTALDLSSLRPESFIIATVTEERVARKLALKWGVYTKLVPMYEDTDDIVREGAKAAKEVLNLNNDDLVCVIGGFPLDAHTNFLKIDKVQ
jgi:pyruvate kinase